MDKPRGACLGMDPNVFFPEAGESTGPARAVCAGCWATLECLTYAVKTGQTRGIYAGMNLRERRVRARELGIRRLPGD